MTTFGLLSIVFSVTLLITKSRLLACKREYVDQRYKASKQNKYTSCTIQWLHRIWHAIWTCPMCSGAWIAFVVCLFGPGPYIANVAICFGFNWLLHCCESLLFNMSKYFDLDDGNLKKDLDKSQTDV